ncbi:helix-turn-helix transcriptional regulator [Streptomyces sp. CAI-21]|nr:helix-turn-helix transcriptional regulator [Streptomyces sp. CAI-21]
MSQADLASAAGLGTRTIGNYERGRVPEDEVIPDGYYDVARVLGWSPESVDHVLAGGKDPAQSPAGQQPEQLERLASPVLALGDMARDMGAPADVLDRYRLATMALIGWMTQRTVDPDSQAVSGSIPAGDRERILRALEDDK